jgi:hypothetical protein
MVKHFTKFETVLRLCEDSVNHIHLKGKRNLPTRLIILTNRIYIDFNLPQFSLDNTVKGMKKMPKNISSLVPILTE